MTYYYVEIIEDMITIRFLEVYCTVPENLHPPPPRKGLDFPGGVNLPNFLVGRGGRHREIFPEGSRDA